jgi:hypothetical protein
MFGIAFDPNFATNKYVYVYYTTSTAPIHNRVSRFTANGDVAAANSETIIFELDEQESSANHNAGALHFGPDGKLYISVGDNSISTNPQSLNNLRGKILRINPDGSIPSDNPFYTTATGKNRAIWARGLRNPYTMAFQPGTGRFYINDVGLTAREEIDEGVKGGNYGWPTCEGPCNPSNPSFKDPIHSYTHASGCSISGGAFYNPPTVQFPSSYVGKYFFADWCGGWINVLDPANGQVTPFLTGGSKLVDVRVAPDGSLYYLSHGNGEVYKIRYTQNQAPSIVQQPASKTVAIGQTATFSVSASGTQPLTYQWQKNGANISGATSPSYSTPGATAADNGTKYRAIVRNAFGTATSSEATLTVTSNTQPDAVINTPAQGATYKGGDVINFSGVGTDAEDGQLPLSNYTWEVRFYHHPREHPDHHYHQVLVPRTGFNSGSFTVSQINETAADVWYRIFLTVKDSSGLERTVRRDVLPLTANINLQTQPAGLKVTIDGAPQTAPFTSLSVVNMKRQIGVVTPQTLNGVTYEFDRWSDGGAATHTIDAPAQDTTYTAVFRQVSGNPTHEVVVRDSFGRTVKDHWGQAELGGAYGLEGTPANFDVENGEGIMFLGAPNTKRSAYIPNTNLLNGEVLFRFKRSKTIESGSQIASFIMRRVGYGNEYVGRVRFVIDGTVRLQAERHVNSDPKRLGNESSIPNVPDVANAYVWVRGQVYGTNPTTIRMKAWADGTPEPANWQYTVTDSEPTLQKAGGVGLRGYLATNATNHPVRMYFDDWNVKKLP